VQDLHIQDTKMRFEILAAGRFREIAVVTLDDCLMLAPDVTPNDLPGVLGQRVRDRLNRGEIVVAAAALGVAA
jgi:hypothetical protein